MMLAAHMFAAITGGIASVICVFMAGHPLLVSLVCYPLGGLLGVATICALSLLRRPFSDTLPPEA